MDTISFKRHRFPPEIIRRAVWLYARFTLSYRDVESFNGKLRDELLNVEIFDTLWEAKVLAERWRREYTTSVGLTAPWPIGLRRQRPNSPGRRHWTRSLLNGPVKTLAKSSLPKSHPVLGGITR